MEHGKKESHLEIIQIETAHKLSISRIAFEVNATKGFS